MKNKVFIILSILAMSLFFTKMDVYAAEDNITAPYMVDCYATKHNFDQNGQESTSEIWSVVLSSNSLIDIYYFTTFDTPFSGDYIVRAYAVSESPINDSGTVFDYQGKKLYGLDVCYITTGFYSGNSGYIDFWGNGANEIYKLKNSYGDVNSFIYDYKRGGLDYEISIDWNNPIYNENIGYLLNVLLKTNGHLNKDFTITWTANNEQFMSDDWRVQIGFHTRFQKTFFGDGLIYTDLNYISWKDNITYSAGRWQINIDDLLNDIPDCNYPNYSGNFYLRIVHVDESTGLVEYGPWGQLSWYILKSTENQGRPVESHYITIKTSNVLDTNGVTQLDKEEYVEDTESPTSQNYVVNTVNGSVDTFSTGLNKIDFSDMDLSDIGNTFIDGLTSLGNTLVSFPSLMAKVASFLPTEIIALITIGFALVIALRIWGR